MEKEIKKIANLLVICGFFSCGGSGGEGIGNVPNYSGSWSGGVSLVDNTCPRIIPEQFVNLYTLHNVNQEVNIDSNGNKSIEIVLDDGKDTYAGLGEIDANGNGNRFTVTGTKHVLPGFLNAYNCTEVIDFDYSAIDFSNSTAGFVARHSTIECIKKNSTKITCDVTYTGSSYRTADPASGNTDPGSYN